MNKFTKILIGIAILGALGANSLKAACDGCPGACPIHTGQILTECKPVVDAQTGVTKSTECFFSCGCVFKNNGGGGTAKDKKKEADVRS